MHKLFRQVTIVAFTSLSLISASLADNTKAQRSTKANPTKAHLAAGLADKTNAQRSTKAHRMVIQVDQNDPAVMNLALNNATNVIDYYRAKGEDVDVDVVTYGPGLHMLRADTSPVQDRIKQFEGLCISQQDSVLRMQQHQGRHGEKRGSPDHGAV